MKKVAVPVTHQGLIDGHFGHCEFYGVYTITDQNQIISHEIIPSTQGCGCKSNIASVLAEKGVRLMLAGGIGDGAVQVLRSHGIDVIRGCSGNAEAVLKAWLQGNVADSGINCEHHHHHHHHGEN